MDEQKGTALFVLTLAFTTRWSTIVKHVPTLDLHYHSSFVVAIRPVNDPDHGSRDRVNGAASGVVELDVLEVGCFLVVLVVREMAAPHWRTLCILRVAHEPCQRQRSRCAGANVTWKVAQV